MNKLSVVLSNLDYIYIYTHTKSCLMVFEHEGSLKVGMFLVPSTVLGIQSVKSR